LFLKLLACISPFKPDLSDGFERLCAYSVMFEPVGTIDHYISVSRNKMLAYEWSNYRFASAWLNSSKKAEDDKILDPFEPKLSDFLRRYVLRS